jgi:PAS domain S-box-containing protein
VKIHTKTLLIFSLAIALLLSAAFVLTTQIILAQFRQLEHDFMLQRVERFHLDLQARLRPITSAVGDWAPWDDLFEFMQGRKPGFVEANLGAPSLSNLGLNFLSFWDNDGRLVAGQFLDESTGEVSPLPAEVVESIRASGLLPQKVPGDSASGRILVGNRVCLVCAAPVTHNDRQGPVAGTVVGGAFLLRDDVKNIELFSGYRLKILPLADRGESQWKPIFHRLEAGENPVIEPLDEREIAGFSIQNDFRGRPLFLAELISPRVIYLAGYRSILLFLIAFAGAGGVLFFLVWFLSDRAVLSPIRRLGEKVTAASRAGELPRNLGISGKDEIAALARQIEDLASSVRIAQERYRSIVEVQTEFILRYTPDGTLTFVNRALCKFLGRDRSALFGTSMLDLFSSDDRAALQARIARLSREHPSFEMEQRFEKTDGTECWLSRVDRAEFGDSGDEPQEIQSVLRDITESRRAKQELQASEARYRTFFEAAADGIMIVDGANERILDVNPGLSQLFGWPKEHFLGEVFWKIPPFPRLVAKIASLQTVVLWPGVNRLVAAPLKNRHGDIVYVDIITVSYLSSGRQVVQWNFRDVTSAKRSEDALRQLSGRLLKLQDEERRRIARELHDSTGQNLTALQINLSLLDTVVDGSSESEAARLLRDTRSLADRCCTEIRTISYLLHPPLLDEVGLAFAVKWFVEGFSKRTGLPVELHIPEEFPRMSAEAETSLFRVVQETMSNVHRHSGASHAQVDLTVTGTEVVLVIRDDGKGMPPELVEAVNRSNSSLGVGLAGMRERLAQLGGRLVVTSDSTGTVVRATIPASEITPWNVSES